MTYLEAVNKVLLRLREDQVSSVASTEYSQLIGEFVNDAKEDLEDMRDWYAYLTTVPFSVTAGNSTGDVSASTNMRSSLAYDDRVMPLMFDVTTDTEKRQIWETSIQHIQRWAKSGEGLSTGTPWRFSINFYDGTVYFDANTEVDRDFEVDVYVPQPAFSNDTDMITLPTRPVIQGALFYALNERGEEIGEPGNIAEQRYERATSAAIENDDRMKREYLFRMFTNDEVMRLKTGNIDSYANPA